jgi:glycosyltransferase involved in cell wall biosynthesis
MQTTAAPPRLSFVIPAYNEEAYVGDCLRAILEQTAGLSPPAEIIVVNNASTDRTRQVALAFPGVTVVDEARKGLTFARQAGFAASTGDLIANVDADSRLTPGWVAEVLRAFEHDPKLAALSGPLVYYDLSPSQLKQVRVFYGIAWMTYALNRWVFRLGSMIQGGNFVVARPALQAIGGFDTTISFYGEDTDIARRLHAVGPTRFTFALKMNSSARRLNQEGLLTTAWRYSLNYFWTTLFKRPFTEKYTDIREQEKSATL